MLTFPADRRGSRRLENAGSRTITHYREPDQEHPGVAACSMPPNGEGLTRQAVDVDCPVCVRLMQSWGVLSIAALLLTLAFPAAAQNPVEVTVLEATGTDEHVMLWDTDADVFAQRRMIAIGTFLTASRPAWQNGGAQVQAGPTFVNCTTGITCAAVSGGGVSIEGTATPGTSDGRLSALDFDAASRELTATLTQGHSDVTVTIPGGGSGAIETITEGSNGGLALVGCLQADTTCALSVANGEVTPEMLEASNAPSGSTRFYREDGIWTLPAGSAFTWGRGIANNGNTIFLDVDELDLLAANEGVQTTDTFAMVNESDSDDDTQQASWTQMVDALATGDGLARQGRGLAHRWSGLTTLSGAIALTDRLGIGRGTGGSEGVFKRTYSSFLDALAAGDLERSGLNLVVQDGAIDADALAADAVGPDQMDAAGTSVGDVMRIGSGGAPEWGLPFEVPRVRLAQDVSVSGPFNLLAATIDATSSPAIDVSATITVSQVGIGACWIRFWRMLNMFPRGETLVTSSEGESTATITTTLPASAVRRGRSFAVAMELYDVDITPGDGESCSVDAGEATLTLSTQ